MKMIPVTMRRKTLQLLRRYDLHGFNYFSNLLLLDNIEVLLFLQHEVGKKRAAESSMLKTPLSDKKAKVATPSAQKIGVPLNGLTKLSSKIV
jgi:hypothetical protein